MAPDGLGILIDHDGGEQLVGLARASGAAAARASSGVSGLAKTWPSNVQHLVAAEHQAPGSLVGDLARPSSRPGHRRCRGAWRLRPAGRRGRCPRRRGGRRPRPTARARGAVAGGSARWRRGSECAWESLCISSVCSMGRIRGAGNGGDRRRLWAAAFAGLSRAEISRCAPACHALRENWSSAGVADDRILWIIVGAHV